jgi:hypothetical protein
MAAQAAFCRSGRLDNDIEVMRSCGAFVLEYEKGKKKKDI